MNKIMENKKYIRNNIRIVRIWELSAAIKIKIHFHVSTTEINVRYKVSHSIACV